MLIPVRCKKCKKLLCKVDEDGLIHVKWNDKSPQVIVRGEAMIICPEISYISRNGQGLGVPCRTSNQIKGDIVAKEKALAN